MDSLLFVDIEVLFGDKFPCAINKEDEINRIYCLYANGNKEIRYLLTTFSIPNQSEQLNVVHLQFASELELIFGFGNLIKILEPKNIAGYNIKQFGFNYIHDRLKYLSSDKLNENYFKQYYNLEWVEEMNNSNDLGLNIYKFYKYQNADTTDILNVTKSKHKLKSYRLTNVLKDLLKIDVTRTNLIETNNIFKFGLEQRVNVIREEFELLDNLRKLYQVVA